MSNRLWTLSKKISILLLAPISNITRESFAKQELRLDKNRAYQGKQKSREAKKTPQKTASILSGIHYQDSRGMLRINPSDAFSVLLTFSSSPKRHVMCQRAFIKLDQRENNVKTHGSP